MISSPLRLVLASCCPSIGPGQQERSGGSSALDVLPLQVYMTLSQDLHVLCRLDVQSQLFGGELFNTHYHRLHAADERTRNNLGTSTRPHRRTRGSLQLRRKAPGKGRVAVASTSGDVKEERKMVGGLPNKVVVSEKCGFGIQYY